MSFHYTVTLRCDASIDFRPLVRCPAYHSIELDSPDVGDGDGEVAVAISATANGWRPVERANRLWHACPRHFEIRPGKAMPRIYELEIADVLH